MDEEAEEPDKDESDEDAEKSTLPSRDAIRAGAKLGPIMDKLTTLTGREILESTTWQKKASTNVPFIILHRR